MARYNELNVGRYNRFLQKLLSMKGEAPAPQLASEISATWALFHGRENRYLEAWQTFAASVTTGASVGNFSAARIRMPAGSNVVAVLERIEVFSAATGFNIIYNSSAASLANEALGITSLGLDPRGITNGNSIISSSPNAGAIAGQSMATFQTSAANVGYNYIFTDIQELPLLPGSQYSFATTTTNLAFSVNFLWRERFLEDSERA